MRRGCCEGTQGVTRGFRVLSPNSTTGQRGSTSLRTSPRKGDTPDAPDSPGGRYGDRPSERQGGGRAGARAPAGGGGCGGRPRRAGGGGSRGAPGARRGWSGIAPDYRKAPNALVKASGSWRIELHVASAVGFAPPAHCTSRVPDHIASLPIPFSRANATSCVASSTVKISVATSFTPIMGVTATAFQAAASERPSTPLSCACVAVAAWAA